MAQAVNGRSVIAKARVQTGAGPCGLCGGLSGTRPGFSRSATLFLCQLRFENVS